jgi:DNA-binding transcriptional ArsR family regulator
MGRDGDNGGSGRRSSSREPLSAEVVELIAERLRAVAKAKSIALLDALRDGEAGVQELADRVGLAHQNASHHLGLLWRAGILSRRREGPMTFYAIEDWSAWWVIEQMADLAHSTLEGRDGS